MDCISPPELDTRQLSAYVDGNADQPVVAHVARCPYCRNRAQQLASWQHRLTARLYRLTCPRSEELGEYHLGMLNPDRAAAIQRHLSECPYCTREVLQLENYLRALAPTIEFTPLERAKVLIARIIGGGQGWGQSTPMPALAGVRGDARGPLMAEADGVLIVLDIQPAAEGLVTILGQIAADDQDRWTGAQVELRQANELRMTVTVDDLGAFRTAAIAPGSTEILITPSSGNPILIQNIDIVI